MQDSHALSLHCTAFRHPVSEIQTRNPPFPHLATVLRALTALKTALAPFLAHKATTQRRQTRRQATPVLLLLARRLRRRLLVLHRLLLALRRVVAHGLLGRVAALLRGVLLRVTALAAVAIGVLV
jgi:hypothetical protein